MVVRATPAGVLERPVLALEVPERRTSRTRTRLKSFCGPPLVYWANRIDQVEPSAFWPDFPLTHSLKAAVLLVPSVMLARRTRLP